MFKINEKFLTPAILICNKCGNIDNPCIIKENKHIYQICEKCGYEEDKGLFNKYNLKYLGYIIKENK